jgi:outer membrane lipoprotein-sorting protein
MNYSSSKNQGGFGYLGIIIAIVVLVAVGGTGWWVMNRDKNKNAADTTIQDAIENAKCTYDDEDLCKFFTGWKAQDSYTVTSVSEAEGQKSTFVMQVDGKKTHLKMDGALAYEVITIDGTTYTKAGDTWWKQTSPNETAKQYEAQTSVDFEEPASDTTAEPDKTSYNKLGKEKCGNFNCFKYEVVNPTDTGTKSFLWFDDEDYQLRRTLTTSGTTTYDATYSYEKVSVNVPSPVKDLGPDQYIVPGQNEPISLPSAGDGMPSPEELQQLLEQYQ